MERLDPIFRKLEDTMRSLATFSAAGIAGVIGLMRRPGPVALELKLSGLCFLVAVIGIMAGWFVGMNRDYPTVREMFSANIGYFVKTAKLMNVAVIGPGPPFEGRATARALATQHRLRCIPPQWRRVQRPRAFNALRINPL